MSVGKKLAHKAEAYKGAAKKYFGRATGNTRLSHRGTRRSVQGQHQTGRRPRSKTRSNTDPPAQSIDTETSYFDLKNP